MNNTNLILSDESEKMKNRELLEEYFSRSLEIKNETLRKYFPRNYTPRQMENIIIKLLDQWQLKKQQAKQKKQEEAR